MEAQKITIESEFKRRMDLINSLDFRQKAVLIAQKIGVTTEEWNENKPLILLYIANKYCSIENELNR